MRKHWPDVPIAEDVKELANDPDGLVPDCDIITAGYPCQPFSLAGERRGAEDDRHIWPEIFAIVKAKRPAWTVFENVYGHITMGIDEELVPSTRPTEETGFGSSPEMWATPSAADSTKSTGGSQHKSLRTDVKLWPTPLAQEAKHGTVTDWKMTTDHVATKHSLRVAAARSMWPTPSASDGKGSGQNETVRDRLDYAVEKPDGKRVDGSLNPQWVEWLMGYPKGWTDLED